MSALVALGVKMRIRHMVVQAPEHYCRLQTIAEGDDQASGKTARHVALASG